MNNSTYLYSEKYNEYVKIIGNERTLVIAQKEQEGVSVSTGTNFSVRVYRTAQEDGLYEECSKQHFDESYSQALGKLSNLNNL